jgi:hypothetical protein
LFFEENKRLLRYYPLKCGYCVVITLQGVIVETARRPWRRKEAFVADKNGFSFVDSPVPGKLIPGGSARINPRIGWGSGGGGHSTRSIPPTEGGQVMSPSTRLPVFPTIDIRAGTRVSGADLDGRDDVVLFREAHTVVLPPDRQ